MYLSLAVLGQSTLWCIFFTCENQFKDCLSAEPKGQTLRIEESFKDKSPSIWGMGGKFSSVASNSLRPHGLQYTRIPCPSPTPEAYSNSCRFESVMPSNHLILCCPILLPPSVLPSIRVSSNESVLHIRWTKCWNFSFSISPSSYYSGLISFRMDWLDLLAVQGTLKSLLQHHSSKASINSSALSLFYAPTLISNFHMVEKQLLIVRQWPQSGCRLGFATELCFMLCTSEVCHSAQSFQSTHA